MKKFTNSYYLRYSLGKLIVKMGCCLLIVGKLTFAFHGWPPRRLVISYRHSFVILFVYILSDFK